MFEISEGNDMGNAKIKVVGIGGGGCNAVNTMIKAGLSGVEYIVANTDAQALNASLAPTKIQLGAEITKGLGAGSNPEIARKAALDEYEKLSTVLEEADMVFITAGMGGGTGTGAGPIVAKLAKDLGALTVGVITKPFLFEGKKRMRQACKGIEDLEECVDSLITIPNQKLLQLAGESLSLVETFQRADDVLLNAVQGISDLINNTGLINADFADVSTVMSNKGIALMGTGICSGADRAIKAANEAISSPLLEDITIDGATGIIVNITGDETLTTYEANEAMTLIMEAADDEAEIIFGTVIDESLNDAIKITVIATGLMGTENKGERVLAETLPHSNIVESMENDSIPHNGPLSEENNDLALQEAKDHVESTITQGPMSLEDEKTILALKLKKGAAKEECSNVHKWPESENIANQAQNSEVHDDTSGGRAKTIAEQLGFINFNEDELDTPSYLRKEQ